MANASSVTELQEKLPLRAKLGYGTIGLSTMANVMFATWQMFFYTTFAGIEHRHRRHDRFGRSDDCGVYRARVGIYL